MSEQAGKQQQTVADALAQRVEARQGTRSGWAEALRELGAVDRAVYQAVARTPTPALDRPFRGLSNAANYSRLWLGIAAAVALTGGKRGRRAALEGVLAVGVTSATINLGIKPLARRRRPDRADPAPHGARQVRMPESDSFPSGHAASAFAFAYAVGRHLPGLAVPIRLLAVAVGYSRVHTGVHYLGDVVIGSVLGSGTAAMTAAACDPVRFPQNSGAYEALSKLSAAPGGFEIRSAAIVERDKDGHLHMPEGGDEMAGAGTAGGSLIGMLVGVLGGQVGMPPVGRCMTGAYGRNALLTETVEDTTEPLDTFASEMGGTIVRRPLDEVVAELEAQQAAAEEAEKAARKAIREQKKQEHKEIFQQRVDALEAKFRKQ